MNSHHTRQLMWACLVLGCLSLSACANTRTMYNWDGYEDQIYSSYSDPGKVPVEQQIENMEASSQRNTESATTTPPGFRAHLGFLYFQVGKLGLALHEFEGEKAAFPESTVFVDRMIARIHPKKAKK